MKNEHPSKTAETEIWPRKVQPGRAIVRVYRRKTPQGNFAFMVANYVSPTGVDKAKRRFDSYATEAEALDAADTLAKRLDRRDYVAANMTREQAIEYFRLRGRARPV